MSIITTIRRLACAATVLFGPHGAVSEYAEQRGASRQSLYRQTDQVLRDLDPAPRQEELTRLRQQLAQAQTHCAQLQHRLANAVVIDRDKQAEFVATGQAVGVSVSALHTLLRVLLGKATPSVAQLGRFTKAAGQRAGALLRVLDRYSRRRAKQVAADEVFSGRKPVLMTVEQNSLCWLGGHLAQTRDGETWFKELRELTAAEQVTSDGALGIRKALAAVNAQRQATGVAAVAEQRDHFHIVHRARRGRRGARYQATQALARAEKLQAKYDDAGRAGQRRSPMQGRVLNQAWPKAEQAMDRWAAQEQADERLRSALALITPEGTLNTPERARAEAEAAVAGQSGDDWARARRLLTQEAYTFLERVHARLAALPIAPELRQAAVDVEALRRRPEACRGETPRAAAARAVGLVAGVILALAGPAGAAAQALVREVFDEAWRSSSLVEGVNSVVRMHQRRQKRLTQGLLDLQRSHWNMHEFRAGKRKRSTPYGRMGLVLPPGGWWALLKQTPQELEQQLSALNPAA